MLTILLLLIIFLARKKYCYFGLPLLKKKSPEAFKFRISYFISQKLKLIIESSCTHIGWHS